MCGTVGWGWLLGTWGGQDRSGLALRAWSGAGVPFWDRGATTETHTVVSGAIGGLIWRRRRAAQSEFLGDDMFDGCRRGEFLQGVKQGLDRRAAGWQKGRDE